MQAIYRLENYLSYIHNFCEVLDLSCQFVEVESMAELNSSFVSRLLFTQRDGFIIDLMNQTFSEALLDSFLDQEESVVRLVTIFSYALFNRRASYMAQQLSNAKRHLMVGDSFPQAIQHSSFLSVLAGVAPERRQRVPILYPRVSDALKAIDYMVKSSSTDLSGHKLEGIHGTVSFDPSNGARRTVLLVRYDYETQLMSILLELSNSIPSSPLQVTFVPRSALYCDHSRSGGHNGLWTAPSKPIGVIVSMEGHFMALNYGLLDIIQGYVTDLNQKGGLLGYHLIPLIYNDKSVKALSTVLARRLATESKALFIIGLVDPSQKKEVVKALDEVMADLGESKQGPLLLYLGTVEPLECNQNVFFFGFLPSRLYPVPFFIKHHSIPARVVILTRLTDASEFESDFLVTSMSRLSIEITGSFVTDGSPETLSIIVPFIEKSLVGGGYVISMLRGAETVDLLRFLKPYNLQQRNVVVLSIEVSYSDVLHEPSLFVGHYLWMSYTGASTAGNNKAMALLHDYFPGIGGLNSVQASAFEALQFYTETVRSLGSISQAPILERERFEFECLYGRCQMDSSHYVREHGSLFTVEIEPSTGEVRFNDLFVQRAVDLPTHVCDPLGEASYSVCDWSSSSSPAGLREVPSVNVGLMYDLSGSNSYAELPILVGLVSALMASNDAGGVLGRRVLPIIRDSRGNDRDWIALVMLEFRAVPSILGVFACALPLCRTRALNALNDSELVLWFAAKTDEEVCDNRVVMVGVNPTERFQSLLSFLLSSHYKPVVMLIYEPSEANDFYVRWVERDLGDVGEIRAKTELTLQTVDDAKLYDSLLEMPIGSLIIMMLDVPLFSRFATRLQSSAFYEVLPNYAVLAVHQLLNQLVLLPAHALDWMLLVEPYFPFVDGSANQLFKQTLLHYTGMQMPTSEDDYGFTSFNLWRDAVTRADSLSLAAVKENLIGATGMSASGLLRVHSNQYVTHRIFAGYHTPEGFVVSFKPRVEVFPEAFNPMLMGNGKICWLKPESPPMSTPDETPGVFFIQTTYIAIILSLTGMHAASDSSLAYTAIEILYEANAQGGLLGSQMMPYMINDFSDPSLCDTRVLPALRLLGNRVSLVISGTSSECRMKIRELPFDFTVAAISYVDSSLCDANVLYYGIDPGSLERGFNVIFARNYRKMLTVGGDQSKVAHLEYAIKYFSSLGQDIHDVGSLISEAGIPSIIQKIRQRLPNGGLVLFFSYASYLRSFLQQLTEAGMLDPLVHVITFNYFNDDNPYEYEAIGPYFESLPHEENLAGLKVLRSKLALDSRMVSTHRITEIVVNIYNSVMLWFEGTMATGSFNALEVLAYLRKKGQVGVRMEGPVRINSFNLAERKIYIGKHITTTGSLGGFEITYESATPIATRAFRLLDFDYVNYECAISSNSFFNNVARESLPIHVLIPLRGPGSVLGTSIALGVIAAIEEVNSEALLNSYLYPIFVNVMEASQYLPTIYSILALKDNVFFIGGVYSRVRMDISQYIMDNNVLFFYPWINGETSCSSQVIVSGSSGNQIAERAIYTAQSISTRVATLAPRHPSMEGNRNMLSEYVVPLLQFTGMDIVAQLEYQEPFDYFQLSTLKSVIVLSMLEDENVPFLEGLLAVGLTQQACLVIVLVPTSLLLSMDPVYLEGHILVGSFFQDIVGSDVSDSLNAFSRRIADSFDLNVISALVESAYSSLHIIANGLFVSAERSASAVLDLLSDVTFQGPTGTMQIGSDNIINRRLFSVRVLSGQLVAYQAPVRLMQGVLMPMYTGSFTKNCRWEAAEQAASHRSYYVVVVHEVEGAMMVSESFVYSLVNVFLPRFVNVPELRAFSFRPVHLRGSVEALQQQFAQYPDPLLVLGCSFGGCRDAVLEFYAPRRVIFFYNGFDSGVLCDPFLFFVQTEVYQRYFHTIPYFRQLQFHDYIVLYSRLERHVYEEDVTAVLAASELALVGSCEVDTGAKDYSPCIALLKSMNLSSDRVVAVLSTLRPRQEETFRQQTLAALGESVRGFAYIFQSCMHIYWSTTSFSSFDGSYCLTSMGRDETIEINGFLSHMKNTFGSELWTDEDMASLYAALDLFTNALKNALHEVPSETELPSSDYIRIALKAVHRPTVVSHGGFLDNGFLERYIFVKSINDGKMIVQHPTAGLITTYPRTASTCLVSGKTSTLTNMSDYRVMMTAFGVALLLLLAFYVKGTMDGDEQKIVQDDAPSLNNYLVALLLLHELSTTLYVVNSTTGLCLLLEVTYYFPIVSVTALLLLHAILLFRNQRMAMVDSLSISHTTILIVLAICALAEISFIVCREVLDPSRVINVVLDSSSFIEDKYISTCSISIGHMIGQYIVVFVLAVTGIVFSVLSASMPSLINHYTYRISAFISIIAIGLLDIIFTLIYKSNSEGQVYVIFSFYIQLRVLLVSFSRFNPIVGVLYYDEPDASDEEDCSFEADNLDEHFYPMLF